MGYKATLGCRVTDAGQGHRSRRDTQDSFNSNQFIGFPATGMASLGTRGCLGFHRVYLIITTKALHYHAVSLPLRLTKQLQIYVHRFRSDRLISLSVLAFWAQSWLSLNTILVHCTSCLVHLSMVTAAPTRPKRRSRAATLPLSGERGRCSSLLASTAPLNYLQVCTSTLVMQVLHWT